MAPPTFGQQHFFRGFHTPLTERYHQKWWFFYVSHMVMSDKTAIFQLRIMTLNFFNLLGDYCNPQHRVTSIATAFGLPTFKWKLPPCYTRGNINKQTRYMIAFEMMPVLLINSIVFIVFAPCKIIFQFLGHIQYKVAREFSIDGYSSDANTKVYRDQHAPFKHFIFLFLILLLMVVKKLIYKLIFTPYLLTFNF